MDTNDAIKSLVRGECPKYEISQLIHMLTGLGVKLVTEDWDDCPSTNVADSASLRSLALAHWVEILTKRLGSDHPPPAKNDKKLPYQPLGG